MGWCVDEWMDGWGADEPPPHSLPYQTKYGVRGGGVLWRRMRMAMAAAAAASERSDRRSAGRGRERNPGPSDGGKKAAEKKGYSSVHSTFENARKK